MQAYLVTEYELWVTAWPGGAVCNVRSDWLQAYLVTERVQWVKAWPGQVVLCVSQIFWTLEVHEAIGSHLAQYYEKLNVQLEAIVKLVRGPLTTQQRITLGALVTIDVHARDVIHESVEKGAWGGGGAG